MDDLASWLTAQLDEDTRTASSWHTLDCDIHAHLEGDADSVKATMAMFHQAPGLVCDCGGPARMLREIDAKRQVLAEYLAAGEAMDRAVHDSDTAQYNAARAEQRVLGRVIRRDATAYADRPGYSEEWRP